MEKMSKEAKTTKKFFLAKLNAIETDDELFAFLSSLSMATAYVIRSMVKRNNEKEDS